MYIIVVACNYTLISMLALTPGAVIDAFMDYRNLNWLTLGFECTVDRLYS